MSSRKGDFGRFFCWTMVKRRFLVTFLHKLVAFFVTKSCVYGKKAVILQRKMLKNKKHKNYEKEILYGTMLCRNDAAGGSELDAGRQ
jgi:hypothetical protein